MTTQTQQIEGAARKLLEEPNYAVVSIPRDDGSVQSVVVWQAPEGGSIALNSAEGRAWPDNLRRAGQATVLVMDRENPYEWVSIDGKLVEDTHEHADEHIDALSKKFLDKDEYPFRQPGEQRVKLILEPQRVTYINQG